jgi:hypothetical protein
MSSEPNSVCLKRDEQRKQAACNSAAGSFIHLRE